MHLGHPEVDHGAQQLVGELGLLETEAVADLVQLQGGNDQIAQTVQPRRLQRPLFNYLAPSECADERVVSRNIASWNQIACWSRQIEGFERPLN